MDTWVQKADFGGGNIILAVAFSISNKGYAGTGYNSALSPAEQNFFWEYDPAPNSWAQKADFGGEKRYSATGFSIGSYGYIGCGESQIGGAHVLKDFWQYDPSNDTWVQKADFGGIARSGAIGFSIGNYGYIGCGAGFATGTLKDFWRYDPSADNWDQIADLLGDTRNYAVGFSIGNYGYVCTGWHQPTVGSRYALKDLWQYDQSNDTWVQKADFGGDKRSDAVGFSDGNYGYCLLGSDPNYPYPDFEDLWQYDPSTNTWSQKTNFGGGKRTQAFALNIGNKGYAGAGYYGGYFKDFWEWSEVVSKSGSSALPLFAKILIG